ncbi:chymotrypsin-like protease CTRL-1 [Haliotis cracherodii]|uniref:chymotrypsin-like protease CTRL-1 n=1 Tax=Haliotis cracherodii TaxID=6455 RepID=UPI0039E911EC
MTIITLTKVLILAQLTSSGAQYIRHTLCAQLYRGTCRPSCFFQETQRPSTYDRLCFVGVCCRQADGTWSQWSAWSTCSVTCGQGERRRSRTCISGFCSGQDFQIQPCADNPCSTNRCGEEILHSRILGGQNILKCTWPYTPLVSIRVYYNPTLSNNFNFGNLTVCGGAIISDQYILTSAVCATALYGPNAAGVRHSTRVVIGNYDSRIVDYGRDGRPEDSIELEEVKIHKDYDNVTTSNNIALFKLRTRIQYNNCKLPACLEPQRTSTTSTRDVPEVDDTCIMASVGVKSNHIGEPSNIPQQARIKLYSRQLTEGIVRHVYPQFLPDGVVIGRTENPSVQTCLFDWGGIVVCRKSNKWWLRGIISTNNCLVSNGGTATPEPPIFITEVANYRQWIDTCVTNFHSCPTLPF